MSRLADLVTRYVAFTMRHAWATLGVAFASLVLSVFAAERLSVDSRLESLLPLDTASARANRELSQRLVSSSPLYLLVQARELEQARVLARKLHEKVSAWPEVEWAMYKRDPEYISKHRLLYLEAADLLELDEQIEERRRYEECERIPGCVNLDEEPPPLPSEQDLAKLFEKNPDSRALVALFGKAPVEFAKARVDSPAAAGPSSAEPSSAEPSSAELGELCDVEHRVCTVQAALDGDPSNLAFATEILARSERLFAELEQDPLAEGARFAVSGQFRNAPLMQRMVQKDLTRTSFLSLGLVLAVVFLQFRGWRSLVMLAVPLLTGIGWTVGVTALWHQSLNLISSFSLAVLMGIGIDFGVHLLTHYAGARERHSDAKSAMTAALRSLGPSLLVAAGTTAAGFGALLVASFRGFSEMGPIAALGVLLSLVATLAIFPPLVAVLDRSAECRFGLRRYRGGLLERMYRKRRPLAGLGTLLALLGVAFGAGVVGPGVEFEHDFGKLRPKEVSHGIPWGGTLHGTSRTAVYLLADDEAALAEVAARLRREPPRDIVNHEQPFLIIPAGFVPKDQEARLAAIAKLDGTLRRARDVASEQTRADIDAFLPLTSVRRPVTVEEMPRWLGAWLTERDGRFGTLGILYSKLGGSDARQMELLANRLDALRKEFPRVRFASPVAQLGEVTPRLRADGPWVFALALAGVWLGTLAVGRSLRRALVVLLPLAVTMAISLGLMATLGIHVNMYNLLVFPLAFGMGIDGAVYVAWALGEDGDRARLAPAARAVLASTLTTIAGFVSLCISNNPGLASIGTLALLMLSASLLANLVWFPSLFWVVRPPRSKRNA